MSQFNSFFESFSLAKIARITSRMLPLVLCLTLESAYAVDLNNALSMAYENNPKMKALQQQYISALQAFPEALSQGFLPDINFQSTGTDQSVTYKNLPNNPTFKGYSHNKGLSLSQNLFAGGSSTFNLAAVKHSLDAQRASYTSSEQEFIFDGIKYYVGLLAAREKLESSKSFIASAKRQHEAEEEKLKVGQSTIGEVANAKAQYSQALYENAKDAADLSSATSAFTSFFGFLPTDLTFPETPSDLPVDFEQFRSKSLPSNLTLISAKAQVKSQRNRVHARHGQLLPRVDLEAQSQEGLSPNQAINAPPQKTKSYATTLKFRVPILSSGGAEYSRIRAEKAKLRSQAFSLDNTKNEIDTQLISHWENLDAARISLQFSKETLDARQIAYEGAKAGYEVGVVSLLDVLKVEKDLYDSKVQYIRSKRDMVLSSYIIKSDLAQLTAKNMKLNAKLFDPELEFRKTKIKVIGF